MDKDEIAHEELTEEQIMEQLKKWNFTTDEAKELIELPKSLALEITNKTIKKLNRVLKNIHKINSDIDEIMNEDPYAYDDISNTMTLHLGYRKLKLLNNTDHKTLSLQEINKILEITIGLSKNNLNNEIISFSTCDKKQVISYYKKPNNKPKSRLIRILHDRWIQKNKAKYHEGSELSEFLSLILYKNITQSDSAYKALNREKINLEESPFKQSRIKK